MVGQGPLSQTSSTATTPISTNSSAYNASSPLHEIIAAQRADKNRPQQDNDEEYWARREFETQPFFVLGEKLRAGFDTVRRFVATNWFYPVPYTYEKAKGSVKKTYAVIKKKLENAVAVAKEHKKKILVVLPITDVSSPPNSPFLSFLDEKSSSSLVNAVTLHIATEKLSLKKIFLSSHPPLKTQLAFAATTLQQPLTEMEIRHLEYLQSLRDRLHMSMVIEDFAEKQNVEQVPLIQPELCQALRMHHSLSYDAFSKIDECNKPTTYFMRPLTLNRDNQGKEEWEKLFTKILIDWKEKNDALLVVPKDILDIHSVLEAAYKQALTDYEVFVVDDSSLDNIDLSGSCTYTEFFKMISEVHAEETQTCSETHEPPDSRHDIARFLKK